MRAAFVSLVVLTATVQAFDVSLGLDDITRAISIGRTGIESERIEFHRPYRLPVGQPPLDYIEVVTPFRRIVLAAEAALLRGERLFGQREALAVLGETPEQVELRLELTLSPLNTFIGVPGYDVVLISTVNQMPVLSRSVDRIPRFGPRVNGQPQSPAQVVGSRAGRGQSQPLLGGTIQVTYDGRQLDRNGRYEVIVADGGRTLARGQLNLSALR
ncbi:MAG: hypothetical protein ABL986_00920 [Vicinamibacterales bacterium]